MIISMAGYGVFLESHGVVSGFGLGKILVGRGFFPSDQRVPGHKSVSVTHRLSIGE